MFFLLLATGGSCHTIARKGKFYFFQFLIILSFFKENQLYISRAEIISIL